MTIPKAFTELVGCRHPIQNAGMGTRFVAIPESGYHSQYIENLLNAKSEDAVYTDRFSVMWPEAPHRVLKQIPDCG